ncbi:MAG: response regulator [Gemmatimonadales bacterium]
MATILVVEDQPDNLKLLATLLTLRGHRVIGLATGDEVAATVRRERPALVLLDIQLPGRDGFAVLEELQGLPPEERPPKVVALTAHAMPEDRARAVAAGFDDYITKPIDVRTFPQQVAALLGNPGAAS